MWLQVHALGIFPFFLYKAFLSLAHVGLCDFHSPLAEREHASLSADGLNVCAAEVIFRDDEFLEIDVITQSHLGGVDLEDASLGLLVWHRKLDFPVDTSRPNHCRIER